MPTPRRKKGQGEVTVKIASISEPALPPEMNGLPFRPAVFEGLTVTPYVKEGQGRPRVAYSLRAREMKPAPKAARRRVMAHHHAARPAHVGRRVRSPLAARWWVLVVLGDEVAWPSVQPFKRRSIGCSSWRGCWS